MKRFLLIIISAIFFWDYVRAGIDSAVVVTLYSNGYIYPEQRSWKDDNIGEKGLVRWSNPAVSTRTFFYPNKGALTIGIRLRCPDGNSRIKVQLDGEGEGHELSIQQEDTFVTLPAGDFPISDLRYHFIAITGLSKTGSYFPDIEAIVLSGPAAQQIKYNTSQYRGAPSTHLRYVVPGDSAVAWFYTEVSVPQGVDAQNAYYETNGFADGYMGIQVNSRTERRFIFSVWSNFRTDDPKTIPSEYAVKLLKKGKGVFSGDFGNEGSGGHTHLVFPWKNGTTYKLIVGAKPAGDHTIFTAWYFAPENSEWRMIAKWDKSKTGGKLLSHLYAFVENFGPNGNDYFKCDYGNQWVCTPSGTWMEMTDCNLTTTADPVKHPRYDYGAGVENNQFYMYSGGFKQLNNLPPHSVIRRQANGVMPAVDLAKLPEN
ncbi:DUF3472 domain-containing protein [Flavitalea flava]